MKKLALLAFITIIAFVFVNSSAARPAAEKKKALLYAQDTTAGWQKAATWTGMKDTKKYIYKINPKTLTVYATLNMKAWSAVVGSAWEDKNGNWIKIQNKKLMTSSDKGTTWTELAGGQWQDADGDWCMFGADWTLWTKK